MMARAAQVATQLLADGDSDTVFLNAKLATARYYADKVLPEAALYAAQITQGAASALAPECCRICALSITAGSQPGRSCSAESTAPSASIGSCATIAAWARAT